MMTFTPPMGLMLPGAVVRMSVMLSLASNLLVISRWDRLERAFFCAGGASGFYFHLTCHQGGDYAVLVGSPCAAIHVYKAGTCAFFAGNPQVAIKQAWGEPFETDGHIV
ncbi:MAG: hypothetical protein Q8K39_19995 [Undibacterium sp.]|nr:hypothetical protein [Undibacterium sp.]MDP1979931.1 hypothetical protein [Undibacterium sp.]